MGALLLATLAAGGFRVPPIDGHVTDPDGRLALAERALEARLDAVEKARGDEVAVLVVSSLEGATIEDAAHATFNRWRLGKKGVDNGVLLLIAPGERKIRIETGRGIGDRLPDALAGRIIRHHIAPRMKEDDLAGAVEHGVEAIAAALEGKPLPDAAPGHVDAATEVPSAATSASPPPAPPSPARKADAYPDWQRREDERWQREYDQRKRDDAQTPFVFLGLGALVVGAIVFGIRRQQRKHRAAVNTSAWDEAVARHARENPVRTSSSSTRSPLGSSSPSTGASSSLSSGSGGRSSSSSGRSFRGGGGSSGGGGASGSY